MFNNTTQTTTNMIHVGLSQNRLLPSLRVTVNHPFPKKKRHFGRILKVLKSPFFRHSHVACRLLAVLLPQPHLQPAIQQNTPLGLREQPP